MPCVLRSAVDLARVDAGVVTRGQHCLAGKVELNTAEILGVRGLTDPGDGGAIAQPLGIGHGCQPLSDLNR